MGDFKSLSDKDAIEKIQELANEKMCMLCTYENGHIVSRPMSTQKVEDDGTMWFMSSSESEKNRQIQNNDHVYMMYMETGKSHYLSLSGHAEVVVDKARIHELWNPFVKAWFEEGEDDPRVTLLKVRPNEGHYWDTKNGRLISLIKIAVAAVTGKEHMDGSLEGNLKP
jgi:general stress protein 26